MTSQLSRCRWESHREIEEIESYGFSHEEHKATKTVRQAAYRRPVELHSAFLVPFVSFVANLAGVVDRPRSVKNGVHRFNRFPH